MNSGRSPYNPQAGTPSGCSVQIYSTLVHTNPDYFPLHTTRDFKTQSLRPFDLFIISFFLLDHASLHEAPKFLCPFVIIFRRIIAFNLDKNHTFVVFIHFDRTLWLYSGKIEAKRSFWLINPNPPDPLPLLLSADLFAIPFSTV